MGLALSPSPLEEETEFINPEREGEQAAGAGVVGKHFAPLWWRSPEQSWGGREKERGSYVEAREVSLGY